MAARAGVSVATVSRALRDLPNVAPATREKVLAAAAELHYVVHPSAAALAVGRTRTIGVVVPTVRQWFFTQIIVGVEGVLTKAGYDIILYTIDSTAGRARFLKHLPFRKRVDGLIVVDVALSATDVERVVTDGLALTLVGTRATRVPSVTIDNVAGASAATRHLLDLGHRRIAFIGARPAATTDPDVTSERRLAFRDALAAEGIQAEDLLDVSGDLTMHGGAAAMRRLLAADQPPTAVFAESDEMAVGAMSAIRSAGLDVPGDISVVGFDDHDVAAYVGLTTVAQPVVVEGETAARLLLDQLAAPDSPQEHFTVLTELVVRSTTGPPGADGRRM